MPDLNSPLWRDIMRTTTRYVTMLTGAVLRLYEQDNIRDPSVSEIACKALHQPLPENPTDWPDSLGGEIYGGVRKHLPMIRDLLEARGHQCAPLGFQYYVLGMRGRVPDEDEVPMCLPSGGPRREDAETGRPLDNRPFGLRLVKDGEADPIYLAHTGGNTKAAARYLLNSEIRVIKAHANGAISTDKAMALADEAGNTLKITPAEMKARITQSQEDDE